MLQQRIERPDFSVWGIAEVVGAWICPKRAYPPIGIKNAQGIRKIHRLVVQSAIFALQLLDFSWHVEDVKYSSKKYAERTLTFSTKTRRLISSYSRDEDLRGTSLTEVSSVHPEIFKTATRSIRFVVQNSQITWKPLRSERNNNVQNVNLVDCRWRA